ncbi:hypothetical protein MRX96_031321 [Rhipicephalus microplus]
MALRREYPRDEDRAPSHRQESWAQEPSESQEGNNAAVFRERAGADPRERCSAASHDAASERFLAPQLQKPRSEHGTPDRRQQSQVRGYNESDSGPTSTSKATGEVQESGSVASSSSSFLVPRDVQGQFPMKGHRRATGDFDNKPASEEASSNDESSRAASSGASEAASAYQSNTYGSEYVRAASLRHTTKDTRRRVTSVADKTEGTSSRTQSYPVDPREGTSRTTLSEPTYAESHLDIRLDYLHELRERINDATNQMFGQMGAEAEQLATDMLQLKMRIRELTSSASWVELLASHPSRLRMAIVGNF